MENFINNFAFKNPFLGFNFDFDDHVVIEEEEDEGGFWLPFTPLPSPPEIIN